ncbi:MAG TPA: hypothetical protein VIY86_11050, partial [Pirellulaceae bacterium]
MTACLFHAAAKSVSRRAAGAARDGIRATFDLTFPPGLVGLAFLVLGGVSAWASPTLEIMDLSLGCGGVCKVGRWVPGTVRLHNSDDPCRVRVSVIAFDPEGIPCEFVAEDPVALSSGDDVQIPVRVRLGRLQARVRVEVREVGKNQSLVAVRDWNTRRLPEVVASSRTCVLYLGPGTAPRNALQLVPHRSGDPPLWAGIANPREIPRVPLDYDGVDAVWLNVADPEYFVGITLDQWKALETWVQGGGRLLVTLGGGAETLLTAAGHPLRALSGVSSLGRFDQRETTGLETYAGSVSRLDVAPRDKEEAWKGVPTIRLAVKDGTVEAADGVRATRTPWVVRRVHGLGIVTVLACDPLVAPLDNWDGRNRLLAQLLEATLMGRDEGSDEPRSQAMRHVGYDDLSGQLRMALDQFPGVHWASFSVVLSLIGGYVLLAGPGDYFLTVRWWHRPAATWWTLPLLAALSCSGCWWLARYWKGDAPRRRQIDFIDAAVDTDVARGLSWMRVFSPTTQSWNWEVNVPPFLDCRESVFRWCGWQGLPGNGLGGMESQTNSASPETTYHSRTRQIGEFLNIELEGLPVPAQGSRGIAASWQSSRLELRVPQLTANRSRLLRGVITN